ncbi:hypothetical protein D9615_004970 [Tricholomella constricta]|uniref:DUF4219 domain-containing protein n=1 Tax=Tricholomella constricta TaxID=117010 RepID=A0A8H5HGX7_9AGAR|nr:hypothetical protein D9615_004970 [Tricholomella constricta]
MSANFATLVPVFNGTNWAEWSSAMQDYLRSQALWQLVKGGNPRPEVQVGSDGESLPETKEHREWDNRDDQALGIIRLRVSPEIKNQISGNSSEEFWQALENAYSKPGASLLFGDFQKAISFRLSGSSNPEPEIGKLNLLLERLRANEVDLPEFVKAMILKGPAHCAQRKGY